MTNRISVRARRTSDNPAKQTSAIQTQICPLSFQTALSMGVGRGRRVIGEGHALTIWLSGVRPDEENTRKVGGQTQDWYWFRTQSGEDVWTKPISELIDVDNKHFDLLQTESTFPPESHWTNTLLFTLHALLFSCCDSFRDWHPQFRPYVRTAELDISLAQLTLVMQNSLI